MTLRASSEPLPSRQEHDIGFAVPEVLTAAFKVFLAMAGPEPQLSFSKMFTTNLQAELLDIKVFTGQTQDTCCSCGQLPMNLHEV